MRLPRKICPNHKKGRALILKDSGFQFELLSVGDRDFHFFMFVVVSN
jgi:hypothetical protein